jgi:hypothetical protein
MGLRVNLLVLLVIFLIIPSAFADEISWRDYEVYQPDIERNFILKADDKLPYNHCATIAWFVDRWFCLWNGNSENPVEGSSRQHIYFSTSFDGKDWSEPKVLFSNSEFCDPSIPCGQGWQWQPMLGVVDGRLWCIWSQAGGKKAYEGIYFSQLEKPEGRWQVRKLTWNDSVTPVINGKKFRIFPTQNLYQLRSGRVLAPVTIKGDRAQDAPDNVTGWWDLEKYNTVLYTDDKGKTWHISPGTSIPDRTWANWEPTVWEVENGDVLMVARHNTHIDMGHDPIKPSQYLLSSVSHDSGETWEPHKYVPLEAICSRSHVSPLDGRGTWTQVEKEDDFENRMHLMTSNDNAGGVNWGRDRDNIALYFNRGSGFTFVPGITVSDLDPRVCYPVMWANDDTMLVSYTMSEAQFRSIRVAGITPLPDPDKHYLLPRNNTMEPVYPVLKSNSFHFEGMQYLESKEVVDPGEKGFSLGIWAKLRTPGAILDSRVPEADGGIVLATRFKPDKETLLYANFHCHKNNDAIPVNSKRNKKFGTKLKWDYDQWQYIGLTYDNHNEQATFYINGKPVKVKVNYPPMRSLVGSTMYIGQKRMKKGIWEDGFSGDIRAMAMYAGPVMDADTHRWLYNKYAESLGQKVLSKKGNRPDAEPILWLDGADKKSLRKYFKPEPENTDGVKVVKHSGKKCLKINGEGSAGVDIDENYRSKGDIVEMKLRYKPLTDNAVVLCTAGDADHPGRVLLRDGKSILTAGSQELGCGEVSINGWNDIYLKTAENYTWVQVNDNAPAIVYHRPQGTWLFLGEGYPRDILSPNSSLLIDVDSVTTKVMRK